LLLLVEMLGIGITLALLGTATNSIAATKTNTTALNKARFGT
jgi:hypothetical protein